MSILRRTLFGLCALLLQAPALALQEQAPTGPSVVLAHGAGDANHGLSLPEVAQLVFAEEAGEASQAGDDKAVLPPAIEAVAGSTVAQRFASAPLSTRRVAGRSFDARGPPLLA